MYYINKLRRDTRSIAGNVKGTKLKKQNVERKKNVSEHSTEILFQIIVCDVQFVRSRMQFQQFFTEKRIWKSPTPLLSLSLPCQNGEYYRRCWHLAVTVVTNTRHPLGRRVAHPARLRRAFELGNTCACTCVVRGGGGGRVFPSSLCLSSSTERPPGDRGENRAPLK